MFKSIILSLCALTGVNRAVATRNVVTNNGYYYYSDLANSNNYDYVITDGDSLYHHFRLSTPVNNNGVNMSDDVLATVSDDLTKSVILYSWSSYNYSVTYDDSATYYDPVISFDTNNRYISAIFNNTDLENPLTQTLLNNNDYFLTFDVNSSDQYIYVFYYVNFTEINDYTSYTYNGYILVNQQETHTVNIPYYYAFDNYFNDYRVTLDVNLVMPSDTGYNRGYSDGYNVGVNTGYQNGYNDGVSSGRQTGYDIGFIDGSNSGNNFVNLFFSVTDTPLFFLKSLFNVEIFGIKVYTVVLSLLTTMVMIWVIRKFVL